MNEVIKLIEFVMTVNRYGDQVPEKRERMVFATLRSVRQSEFYQAQTVGLKPEIVFVLQDYLDYQGEEFIEYKAFNSDEWNLYKVLRTYRTDNSLEIVCTRGVDE